MNFKEEYQKAFSDIKADENFKQNLVAQMNREKKRKKKPAYIGVLAAAAVMVLVLGVGFMTGILKGTGNQYTGDEEQFMAEKPDEFQKDDAVDFNHEIVAEQDMSDTYVDMNFSHMSWYGSAQNEEELLSLFVSMVCGDNLDRMYCTTGETFDENTLMTKAETKELVGSIHNLSCTEEEYAGESKFYKAVFKDGLTIKFWISDEGYLKLNDTGAVFEIL